MSDPVVGSGSVDESDHPGKPVSVLSIEQAYGVRTRQSLEDLAAFTDEAAELVSRGQRTFSDDFLYQRAAESIINRIGEAISRLNPSFVADHPDIPLRQAKDMRNLVSHGYDVVDPDFVWRVLVDRVPPLARQIRDVLHG